MKPDDEREFVRTGIIHYGTAVRTIAGFQTIVQNRFGEALETPSSGRPWTSSKPVKPSSGGGGDPWICATREVVLPTGEVATLSVGLWWRLEGTFLYAGFEDGPEWARLDLRADATPRVKRLQEGDWTYLVLKQSDSPDLDQDLATLLEELNRAVTRAVPKAP